MFRGWLTRDYSHWISDLICCEQWMAHNILPPSQSFPVVEGLRGFHLCLPDGYRLSLSPFARTLRWTEGNKVPIGTQEITSSPKLPGPLSTILSNKTFFNPFTPKSDQSQLSPAASPAILHHTVWRTWLFIDYSDGKWLRYQILATSLMHLSLKGWENAICELGSERVKTCTWGSHKEVSRPFVRMG